ncbi:tRNA 2-methylthio-N6-isopentenyl adenosine(37) hydroxylase MiaE-like protein, partial [Streptomyces nigra]
MRFMTTPDNTSDAADTADTPVARTGVAAQDWARAS